MLQPVKVVLDSNVFSRDHFTTLASSRFLDLVAGRRVVPVFPAVMMEETLRAYQSTRSREQLLTDWLPFILKTRPRFCVELTEIWRRELLLRKGRGASEFLAKPHQINLVQVLESLPADGSSRLVAEVVPDWLRGDKDRRAVREATIALRKRSLGTETRPIEESLPELQRRAAAHLLRFVTPYRAVMRKLLARWQLNKNDYPFFTQAVDDVVFQLLLPLIDHSTNVDVNARPDLEILSHLVRADVLVTNETRFMARAFDEIWRPRGKFRFTSAEFSAFLERLS